MWRRRAGLLCLALSPVLLLAATAADPLGDGEWYTLVGANPSRAILHTVLLHWAWVLLVPGIWALLSPIRDGRGKVLTRIVWVAATFGLATFAGLVLTDVTGVAVAETADAAANVRMDEQVGSYPWLTWAWQLPGTIGWAVSLVLPGIAASRGRVLGWWYAAAAGAGGVLYFLFAIEPGLSLLGPAVMMVANLVAVIRLWSAEVPDAAPDPFRQRIGIACLAAAPVALGVGAATMPGGPTHIAAFSSSPGLAQASAFFLHLSWLLFIPGVLAVLRRVPRGRFAFTAGAVALLGLLNFNGLMVGDYIALAAEQTLTPAQQEAATAATESYTLFPLAVAMPAMLLSLLGLILVPIAAARAGLVRWPVPVVTGVGVVAFLMLTTGRVTGLVAPVILLVGYGLLARALNRPPAPAHSVSAATPAFGSAS